MPHERFEGPELSALLARARRRLGEDAVMLSVRRVSGPAGSGYELVAADARGAAPRAAGAARPGAWAMRPSARGRRTAPQIIALVGPTGAGKTTTIAKLANHPHVFGGWPAGLLCLDTWRIGAVEQLREYAEISGHPFEVAYDERDVEAAMKRLARCDVVLVDTAGRGPAQADEAATLLAPLAVHGPLEVHLVLPAGLRLEHARRVRVHHRGFGITHLLGTKLDECPDETAMFELAAESGLPMRWIADGQEVPRHLRSAEAHRRALDDSRSGMEVTA
jgi:flagellar biosynthesis protein FlhF